MGIEEIQLLCTLDSDTCAACGDLDGNTLAEKDVVPGVTAPPFHANCRCTTIPYFPNDKGFRAARDKDGELYYVPGDETYEQWKERGAVRERNEAAAEQEKQRADEENEEKTDRGLQNTANGGIINSSFQGGDFLPPTIGFDEIPSYEPTAVAKITQAEDIIRSSPTETGILFDTEGNVQFAKHGDVSHVSFSGSEIQGMKGLILSHNHPNASPPSDRDIAMLFKGELFEVRVCNKNGCYVLRNPEYAVKTVSSEEVLSAFWETDAKLGAKFRDMAAREGKSIINYLDQLHQDTVKSLCEQYGILYGWEELA
jgi:hypothetical protein